MSSCCSSVSDSQPSATSHVCPANGKEYKRVPIKTILHHIKMPWRWNAKQQSYYFCDDPDCDVVYFGQDDSVITRDKLRTRVGVKQNSPDATACYCFGISVDEALGKPELKQFVIDMTQRGECACETRNPSGRCCLKDFPK